MTSARVSAPVAVLLCAVASAALPADWYVSDASGIALEASTSSRALRLEHGLSIEKIADADTTPETVRGAVPAEGTIELRTLYERGTVLRRRWAALDSSGFERLVETRSADGGITRERYDASRRFVEEGRFSADGVGTIIRYTYSASRLIRAESFAVAPGAIAGDAAASSATVETPLWTEAYKYLRSGALRSVERTKVEAKVEGAAPSAAEIARFDTLRGVPRLLMTGTEGGSSSRTRYDASGRIVERAALDPGGKQVTTAEVSTYKAEGEEGPASIVKSTEADGTIVETGHDDRGHVISQRRVDAGGVLLSEIRTTWSGNRIASVETVVGTETLRTEYEYDSAENRTMERNYRNGTLERTVRRSGDEETEELYSDGVPVLRAVWVGGRKVSERRIRMGEETGR